MISFLVAAARRRLRQRGRDVHPRSQVSIGRLLVGEVAHLTRTMGGSPRSIVVLSGLLAMVGVYVALGPTYPGLVVVAEVARVVLAAVVLVSAIVFARTLPTTWRSVAQGWRRARIGVLTIGFAALLSVVKVGLHEATPGPALSPAARWGLVAVGGAVFALLRIPDRARRSDPGA